MRALKKIFDCRWNGYLDQIQRKGERERDCRCYVGRSNRDSDNYKADSIIHANNNAKKKKNKKKKKME